MELHSRWGWLRKRSTICQRLPENRGISSVSLWENSGYSNGIWSFSLEDSSYRLDVSLYQQPGNCFASCFALQCRAILDYEYKVNDSGPLLRKSESFPFIPTPAWSPSFSKYCAGMSAWLILWSLSYSRKWQRSIRCSLVNLKIYRLKTAKMWEFRIRDLQCLRWPVGERFPIKDNCRY